MQSQPGSGTDALKGLFGSWVMEASIDGRPLARARMVFDWIEDGDFLRLAGQAEPPLPETPASWVENSPFPTKAIIGFDGATGEYSFLHADSRGVHRVYRMSLDDRTWTLAGSTENGFQQRFTGNLDAEQNTIVAAWESSQDGQLWHHDFDETYTRSP